MIPEREREALMRLTMCARDECAMCKYKWQGFDKCYELATKNMNILADALSKTEPRPCEECKHYLFTDIDGYYCKHETYGQPCNYEPKTEPQTEIKIEPTWVGTTYGRFDDEPQMEGELWIKGGRDTFASEEFMPQTERSE